MPNIRLFRYPARRSNYLRSSDVQVVRGRDDVHLPRQISHLAKVSKQNSNVFQVKAQLLRKSCEALELILYELSQRTCDGLT